MLSSSIVSRLNSLYLVFSNAKGSEVGSLLEELEEARVQVVEHGTHWHIAIFNQYILLIALYVPVAIDLLIEQVNVERELAATRISVELGGIPAEREAGISLVTCSMNRAENLIESILSWIVHTNISEILIVDWSSEFPVADSLFSANIDDPRIRIIRMENETRWILSYAFNLGFRAAKYNRILKVDADIILSHDFFLRNNLVEDSFIAGNWRKAEEDQAFVNGFFFLSSQALHDVNGFNEFITTYGWDDDDIYERLILAGYVRQDVAPDTVLHLDHSDAERTGIKCLADAKQESTLDQLTKRTSVLIEINRVFSSLMPFWDRTKVLLPVEIFSVEGRATLCRRKGNVQGDAPIEIFAAARNQVLIDHLVARFGPRIRELPRSVVNRLLARPATDLCELDVAVGFAAPTAVIDGAGQYIVIDIQQQNFFRSHSFSETLRLVLSECLRRKLQPVVRSDSESFSTEVEAELRSLPVIPKYEDAGLLHDCTFSTLRSALSLPLGNLLLCLEEPLNAASCSDERQELASPIE